MKSRFFIQLIAAAALMVSCRTAEPPAPQTSSTGIYTMESSGMVHKEHRFSASVIRNIETLSTLKNKSEENGSEQLTVKKELAFDLTDDNGSDWRGEGFTLRDRTTGGEGELLRNRLIFEMVMTEQATGRLIKLRTEFDSDGDEGFMTGEAADGEGKTLATIYSSRNLKGAGDPFEQINGFSIHRGDTSYGKINRTRYAWVLSFNLPEEAPQRIDLGALMSALFVLTEQGK